MAKRKRRAFSNEFKAQTVRLVRESGKSIGEVAQELELTESAVRAWVRQAVVDGGRGGTGSLTTEEREELGRLRREVRTLRMERDILKNPRARRGRATCQARNSRDGYTEQRPGSRGRWLHGDVASPLKNMVRGWLALLTVVTPRGDPV